MNDSLAIGGFWHRMEMRNPDMVTVDEMLNAAREKLDRVEAPELESLVARGTIVQDLGVHGATDLVGGYRSLIGIEVDGG